MTTPASEGYRCTIRPGCASTSRLSLTAKITSFQATDRGVVARGRPARSTRCPAGGLQSLLSSLGVNLSTTQIQEPPDPTRHHRPVQRTGATRPQPHPAGARPRADTPDRLTHTPGEAPASAGASPARSRHQVSLHEQFAAGRNRAERAPAHTQLTVESGGGRMDLEAPVGPADARVEFERHRLIASE